MRAVFFFKWPNLILEQQCFCVFVSVRSDSALEFSIGARQSIPGLSSILFVPGNWTVKSLCSVVNNTDTQNSLQCQFCLAVTDSLLDMADPHTGCVGNFLISASEQTDGGGAFILVSSFFYEHYNRNHHFYIVELPQRGKITWYHFLTRHHLKKLHKLEILPL